jgi:hypothetical protein
MRGPDYAYLNGFAVGLATAHVDPNDTAVAAECRRQAPYQAAYPSHARDTAARYLRGCSDGLRYQRAHPYAEVGPTGDLPSDVRVPTVRLF